MENIQDGRCGKTCRAPCPLSMGRISACVLESLVRIKDPAADVPLPESGRWLHAGEILGDGYSLAWRVLDAAQGWGVAQRRKRIFAVLDLDGQCAGKVLFESEGMSGYTPPGGKARKGTASGAENSAGTAGERVSAGGFCTEHSADSRGIGYEKERAPTLRAGVVPGVAIDFNPTDSRIRLKEDDLCQTLCCADGHGRKYRCRWYSAFHRIRATPCCRRIRMQVSTKRIPAGRWTAAAAHRHAIRAA